MQNTEDLLEEFESVRYRIREEGIDYCFKHYSNFETIEDETFHKLRLSYIKSSEEIQAYVNKRIEDLLNEDGD
jgi:hypothetical protein